MHQKLPAGVDVRPALAARGPEAEPDPQREAVVVEEPLEIRLAGEPFATTLRTPGQDHALALGFLRAEGIIRSAADVSRVAHCGHPLARGYGNAIDVLPGPGTAFDTDDIEQGRRPRIVHGGCGACGRQQIEALLERIAPVTHTPQLEPELLLRLGGILGSAQRNFAYTGGLHAAAAITAAGRVVAAAEDIGRHNAVDKVVGRLLIDDALPDGSEARPALLAVSSRSGFEIVQKAAAAGFAVVASVSAASSLAVDTAEALGITLAAFVRDGRYTLYAQPQRVL